MLDTQQEVADLFLKALKESGLKKQGRINFAPTHDDYIGSVKPVNQIKHDLPAVVWQLEYSYPIVEGEETKIYPMTIHTGDFKNEEEVKNFFVQELKKIED